MLDDSDVTELLSNWCNQKTWVHVPHSSMKDEEKVLLMQIIKETFHGKQTLQWSR